MRYAWGITVALAACYSPTTSPGAPCGPAGECPSGLECQADRCLPAGTATDDASIVIDDADIDAPAITPDGASPDAAIMLGPWGTPTEITSLETPGTNETDPTISMNRLTAVVATSTADDIYLCKRTLATDPFTCNVFTAINSTATEKSPELSPSGSTLYFATNRGGNYDIYYSTLSGTTWSNPTRDDAVSSAGDESDIALSPDGLTAAVLQNGTVNHIALATRTSTAQPFGTLTVHNELEVTADIAAPTLTNGGAVMYFHAGATRDIYMTVRKANGTYNTPVLVTELNTTLRDAAPFVSADDRYMVFERDGNIYQTSR
jgi:Tol biopolymer transport system component